MNTAKSKATKYFNFNIQLDEENYKCIYFSPDKRRLIKKCVTIPLKNLARKSKDLSSTRSRA